MEWKEEVERYLRHLETKNWSLSTLTDERKRQERFFRYVWRAWGDRLSSPAQVTREMIEGYVRHLVTEVSPHTGKLVGETSRAHYVRSVKSFYAWMEGEGLILESPAEEVEIPRRNRDRLALVLDEAEAAKLVQAPDISRSMGIRDRAILELLYSTGLRLNELVHLEIFDVDLTAGVVMVRQGKGKKDRVVPLGETAAYYVNLYLTNVRNRHAKKLRKASTVLFLGQRGDPVTPKAVRCLVKQAAKDAGVKATPHAIRRSTATHLLAGGAEPELVQELLGHGSSNALRFYARLFGPEIKEEHRRTHPREVEDAEGGR